jgi:ribosomal protein S18 acetylase RimI-like enzyme
VIRLLREDEFDAWYEAARAGYALSIEEDGGVPHAEAQAKSVKDMSTLWPNGFPNDDHLVSVIEADGEAAGWLWVTARPGMSGEQLFVYEVRVAEAHRGKGLGRALMEFAEEEARRRGLPQVALNVFGGNTVARNLYRTLDYRESAVFMVKKL